MKRELLITFALVASGICLGSLCSRDFVKGFPLSLFEKSGGTQLTRIGSQYFADPAVLIGLSRGEIINRLGEPDNLVKEKGDPWPRSSNLSRYEQYHFSERLWGSYVYGYCGAGEPYLRLYLVFDKPGKAGRVIMTGDSSLCEQAKKQLAALPQ